MTGMPGTAFGSVLRDRATDVRGGQRREDQSLHKTSKDRESNHSDLERYGNPYVGRQQSAESQELHHHRVFPKDVTKETN